MTAAEEMTRNAIEGAEEILDPLDGLVERAAGNPGAPFEPEVLERLSEVAQSDRAQFEELRTKLKREGVRVTALDQAIAGLRANTDSRPPTQANILLGLVDSPSLFHAPDGTGYADVDVNGHRETWAIRSKGLRMWLARRYFEHTGGAPSSEALQSALNVIEAQAQFDAPEREVYVRVASLNRRLYLDLADDQWRAVEIGAGGWRVIKKPPVRFRRAAGMLALPVPEPGGSIKKLRRFLNVRTKRDFVLVVSWLLAALRNCGPYPVLALAGEQGAAKSTLAAVLRTLVDPNSAALRALPREDRDLFIAATNGHVLAFDNVSGLPTWISDTLCRLATGGGFAVRQLYTDQDEVLFDATRPVILNGIEDVVTRPDLADRAILLTLEPLPENRRRPEKEFWAAFEKERAGILGALLNAVSRGLRMRHRTRLKNLPRMADFALWATACETAMCRPGTFTNAYSGNLSDAVENVIDADPVGSAVRSFMVTRTLWTGTASELLGALNEILNDSVRKAKTWPGTPRALSGRLRRAATFLRKVGIDVSFDREGRDRTRTIRIASLNQPKPDRSAAKPSAPSASSAHTVNSNRANGFGPPEPRTVAGDADATGEGSDPTDRPKPLEINAKTAADGADENPPLQPGSEEEGAIGWRARL